MKMSDQAWAYAFVVTGLLGVIICHHFGIPDAVGAGIVGGGLGALTKAESQKKTDVTGENSRVTINQTDPK